MSETAVKNASNESQVKEAEKRQRLRLDQDRDDLKYILQSQQGQRFVWRLLGGCGVFELSYRQSGSETMFNEGRRSVGLKLLAEVTKAEPTKLIAMMQKGDEL